MSGALARDIVQHSKGRSGGKIWWADLGVAPKLAKVRTTITPAILARMGKLRSLLAYTHIVDIDGLIIGEDQRSNNEVMQV